MNPDDPPARPPSSPPSTAAPDIRSRVAAFRAQLSLSVFTILAIAVAAFVIQLVPAWRTPLIYDRGPLAAGEYWRIWTGHLVHFGWPHFLVDTGLLLIVGWFSVQRHPRFTRWAIVLMPAFISASLYWLEPTMIRYAGLSAFNLGLLVYVAAQGWRRDWTDWFWPAVLLIYVAELLFEHYRGGTGGGAIRFDDPDVRVATGAHLASAVYALLAIGVAQLGRKRST